MRLRTKLILLVSSILIVSLAIMYFLMSSIAMQNVRAELSSRAKGIAAAVAIMPDVGENMALAKDHQFIQDYAEKIRQEAGADYIVVFDMEGLRLSHPNTAIIGQHVLGGDEKRSLQGETYISEAEGTLGTAIRAFHPVYYKERQVGAVLTGISLTKAEQVVAERNQRVLWLILIVFACGLGVTVLVAQGIKETLLGMEPKTISRLTVERNMVIQSVREGVVVVDKTGKILVVNGEAQRIFEQAGIKGNIIGQDSEQVIPNTRMLDIVKSGKTELDQEQRLHALYILTNRVPLRVDGEIIGALATFRDLAEVRQLAEELTGVKRYVEALRVQAHEFRNKLHVINGLILNQRYANLSAYVQRLALTEQNEVKWVHKHVQDPVLAAFLQSKLSRSRELAVHLLLDEYMDIPEAGSGEYQNDLITVIGNLVDNAIDAVSESERKIVELLVREEDGEWLIQVRDSGCGVAADKLEKIFDLGFSTKGENRGFGLYLVGKVIEKYNGTVRVTANKPQGVIFTLRLYPGEAGEHD